MTLIAVSFPRILEPAIALQIDLDEKEHHQQHVYSLFAAGRCYEADTTALLMRVVKPGDFVIDVGANVGLFTIIMSKLVGPSGRVLAFEPDQTNLIKLYENLKLNDVHNVTVFECPLWSEREEVPFYTSLDNGGGHSIWDPGLFIGNDKTRKAQLPPTKLPATTLAHEITRVGRCPSFIKIDTEGADEKILHGLGTHRPPYILAESNPFGAKQFGCDNATLRQTMKDYGYDCFLINEFDMLPAMLPDNTTLLNGYNGFCTFNLLFSTLHAIGRAYPEMPNMVLPDESYMPLKD